MRDCVLDQVGHALPLDWRARLLRCRIGAGHAVLELPALVTVAAKRGHAVGLEVDVIGAHERRRLERDFEVRDRRADEVVCDAGIELLVDVREHARHESIGRDRDRPLQVVREHLHVGERDDAPAGIVA